MNRTLLHAFLYTLTAIVAGSIGGAVGIYVQYRYDHSATRMVVRRDRYVSPVAQPFYLCQDALARRAAAERAMASSQPVGTDRNQYIIYLQSVEIATRQRSDADADVRRYCS